MTWRIAGWSAALLLWLLPLAAMQVTDEVRWDAADFVLFGLMLAIAGGAFELAVRLVASRAGRAAIGVGIAAAFLLVWVELAVGIFS